MNTLATLKTLFHLSLSPIRGDTHEQRLESFYRKQAADYDAFRSKLLHGRVELLESLELPSGGVWYDMGAGTGESAQVLSARLDRLARVYLVDLCPSLLDVARRRIADNKWSNVEVLPGDVQALAAPAESADLITFSYSLTMIPEWFLALENAWRLLRPGGQIAVVDFYVSRKHPAAGRQRHSWFTRTIWPAWFATDNVFLSPDHLPYLASRFAPLRLDERRGRLPFVVGARVPYYLFIGKKS